MSRPVPPPLRPVKRALRRPARALRRLTGRKGGGPVTPGPAGSLRSETGPGRPAALLAALDGFAPAVPQPRRSEVTAAVAAGDRVRAGLAWEWTQQAVTPSGWRAVLAAGRPELLLLELAGGRVPGWGLAGDAQLAELVSECRAASVPVVVWVTAGTDDPEPAAPLAETADHLFVHDPSAVERWQARYPSSEVGLLAPAAQPRLHHPERGGPGSRRDPHAAMIIDAGGLDDHAANAMTTVVGPAARLLRSEFDIWAIRDPASGKTPSGAQRSALPGALGRHLVGTQSYETIPAVTGRYPVLVDAGRENRAASWSLLEAGAAQTSVVTLDRQRADLPADLAAHVAGADEAKPLRDEIVARICQPELRDREALRLHRAVLAGHTYAHRVDQILGGLGRLPATRSRSVSVVVPTNREHEIANVFENIARQAHPETELVLVLHGLDVKHREITARARALGVDHLTLVDADASVTLGACLNLGIDAAAGAYIAKMDDDNFYGAHYLTDLVAAFDYTEAGIVGKWAHYVWLRASDAVVLRCVDSEHRYERRVQGGSMVIDGDLARDLRFSDLPRAVDTDFLDRALAADVKIYSADRFNFISVRGTDPSDHTWQVTDAFFMTGLGRLAFFGDPHKHVEV